MKVVGIIGSPRKEGNTSILVNTVLEEAGKKGSETSAVFLNDLDIKGCQGCYHCKAKNACRIDDDMQAVFQEILESDAVILGSPIYFGQVTGQAKNFIDRMFSFLVGAPPNFESKVTGKNMVLAFCQGNPDPGAFKDYIEQTKNMLGLLQFSFIDTIISAANQDLDSVKFQTEVLEQAKKAAENITA